jgi:hypothetical protein
VTRTHPRRAILALALCACGGASKARAPEQGHEPGLAATAAPGATSAPAVAKMSGEIRHLERSKDHLRVDKVGSKDGDLAPDGVSDLVYDLDVEGPVEAILLISTDERGEPNGELAADTLVGKETVPEQVAGLGALGKHTAGLGVFERGKLLNESDGHLPPLSPGSHALVVHLSTKDIPKSGAIRVFVRFTDGSLTKGPTQSLR